MSGQNDWAKICEELLEILKSEDYYHSENKDETCFLSAYQLAILLYKKDKALASAGIAIVRFHAERIPSADMLRYELMQVIESY